MNVYIERRKKLVKNVKNNSLVIIFGSRDRYRNNDVKYRFRQNSNFLYLTGINEPNAICIIEKTKIGEPITSVFSKKKNKKETIWDDSIIGQEELIKSYSIDYAFSINHFEEKISSFAKDKDFLYYISENKKYYKKYLSNLLKNGSKNNNTTFLNINEVVNDQRLIKDGIEVSLMKESSRISSIAHLELLNKIKPGVMEYQLESVFLKSCMDLGAREQAYNPIFASGDNACVLHYSKNTNQLNNNDLILIDAGCEYKGYASDITRTYPIGGTFNNEQKIIYEIVLHAQKEAIKQCLVGKNWNDINAIIIKVISEGLSYFQIVKAHPEEIKERKLYKDFYMHSPGHWLGLDVHDSGNYKKNGSWCPFQKNMCLTIEPGIYINKKNNVVQEKWKGIGIRIEDDILITEKQCEILSMPVPKEIEEVEHAIK